MNIYVNSVEREISTQAYEKLCNLLSHDPDPCCSAYSKDKWYWGCTRISGHKGPHVAHGMNHKVHAVWIDE